MKKIVRLTAINNTNARFEKELIDASYSSKRKTRFAKNRKPIKMTGRHLIWRPVLLQLKYI